jgi:hypothetical protein
MPSDTTIFIVKVDLRVLEKDFLCFSYTLLRSRTTAAAATAMVLF